MEEMGAEYRHQSLKAQDFVSITLFRMGSFGASQRRQPIAVSLQEVLRGKQIAR